jgi:mannan endo-1,4-beta-mannosidase
VAPALKTGELVREALEHLPRQRPFFDSEHGPIHAFKDLRRTLPEDFDDEYFRHMQWAHLASGGAGGGMRWPNRHPHVLTRGMRQAQHSLAAFAALLDWRRFQRRNLNQEVRLSSAAFAAFACGDEQQALVWLLRQDQQKKGLLPPTIPAVAVTVAVPGLQPGKYQVIFWDTRQGEAGRAEVCLAAPGMLEIPLPPISHGLALAVVRI